jgi:thiol-disulfide isomerase/thioredoxin
MPIFFKAVPAIVAGLTIASLAPARAETLTVGSPAPQLKVAKWVKGKPLTIKKGAITVVEFWATWCGPCKESIPHLTELAKKYQGKVDFAGISVFEHKPNYASLVNKFVIQMGAKMDYSVGYDDNADSGFMAKNWMAAAKQDGIPTAFIVGKEGKIEWIGHPMEMEGPLAQIVAGKYDRNAATKQLDAENLAKARIMAYQTKVIPLLKAEKYDELLALVDTEVKNDPSLLGLSVQMLNSVAWTMCDEENKKSKHDFPSACKLAKKAAELTKEEDAMVLDTLAFACYRDGNIKEALAYQEKAVSKLDKSVGVDEPTKKEILDRLALYKSKAN